MLKYARRIRQKSPIRFETPPTEIQMTKTLRLTLFLSILALAALACAIPGLPGAAGGCTPDEGNLFQDNFSDESCGWEDIFNDETGISDYDQGGFRLRVDQEQFDYWANPNVSFSDVVIEVDARKIGGPDDNDFGVICRYVDNQNFYFFIVASDGFYAIGKSVSGDYTYIGSDFMEPTDAVLGGDASNHLRADCAGSTLRLYANGNLLKEVTDSTFTSGDVGLIAGTFDTPGTDILFDNFVVRAP
jgi:hypothetical protein